MGESVIKKYPAYGYRDKWFLYPFTFTEDSLKINILKEMEILKEYEKKDPLGSLYSKSYGYLLINEELKSREAIREMVEKYPDHELTNKAINSYLYMIHSGKIDSRQGEKEVWKYNYDMISRNPGKQFSRDFITSNNLTGIPTKVIEDICKVWFGAEPDNPMPYICLTERYYNDQSNYDRVIELCTGAIDLIVNNKFRKYLDISGKLSQRYLSMFSHRRAWANFMVGNYSEALTDILSAGKLAKEENSIPLLEAKIWMAVDNYTLAEESLLRSLKLGSSEADSLLREVYAITNRQFKDYNEYLRAKLNITTAAETADKEYEPQGNHFEDEYPEDCSVPTSGPYVDENKFNSYMTSEDENKPVLTDHSKLKENMLNHEYSGCEQSISNLAPDFEVVSLDGKKFSLKEIKDKIIVLNFWGLGCGPCLKEIPDLNKIVDKYQNKNVVFIAFSGDSKKYLDEFVKKRVFKYNIIPQSYKQFKDYSINSLPTHFIITPDHKIHNRLFGSGVERYKSLDNQIQLLLVLYNL